MPTGTMLHATTPMTAPSRAAPAGCRITWPLKLLPPPPAYGINYSTPATVFVSFTTPQPVQVVLYDEKGVLLAHDYRAGDPTQSVLGTGALHLVGGRFTPSAA
jgi:hypothetical protein